MQPVPLGFEPTTTNLAEQGIHLQSYNENVTDFSMWHIICGFSNIVIVNNGVYDKYEIL